MRGNFISDMAYFLFLYLCLFYVKGWMDRKYVGLSDHLWNRDILFAAVFLVACLLIQDRNEWKQIPFIREYRELLQGKYEEYSEFCLGIYEQIEKSSGEYAEVHTDFVEYTTCQVNPLLYEGWYDEDEYANTTIARFYGKKAVYIYYNE